MKPQRPGLRRSPRLPAGSSDWSTPWVQLRSATFHPFVFRQMIAAASPNAAAGALVAVYDKHGQRFGSGFYNPKSLLSLRMVSHDREDIQPAFFENALDDAVKLRRDLLRLDASTNAYRVVNAEGDGLTGLVVDRFADVLSVETFALGPHLWLDRLVPHLHAACGTKRAVLRMDERARQLEGVTQPFDRQQGGVRSVRVEENGVRFAVGFETGQKTGFFCDQRDNRRQFAEMTTAQSVLDLCCYTGGFSIYAMKRGEAREATGVDLDERAIDQARHNANLNQVRVRWTHADAFTYGRQMLRAGKTWDAVVLDPPKLILSRAATAEGERKYFDFNKLASHLVKPGGLLVTCSCSGLLEPDVFQRLVVRAARAAERRLQILNTTGAAPDHPMFPNCPESLYLKVLWARVL